MLFLLITQSLKNGTRCPVSVFIAGHLEESKISDTGRVYKYDEPKIREFINSLNIQLNLNLLKFVLCHHKDLSGHFFLQSNVLDIR